MPSPDESAALLEDAGRDRDRLAADLVVPRGYDAWIGAALTVHIATAAVGVAIASGAGLTALAAALMVSGVVVFGVVAVVQVVRFRRLNGVLVSGFVSRVVFGSATTASLGHVIALAAAIGAALHELWWLVGPCSVAGAAAYVLSGRRWLRAYRGDPAAHSRGESLLALAALLALAVVGLVLLLSLA